MDRDTLFGPKRIKARAIDWDQIHADFRFADLRFIRARGDKVATRTPYTWPQQTKC